MLVYPVALLLRLAGVADGVAVLDDVFALGKVLQRKLVSCGNVLFQSDFMTFDDELYAFQKR